MNRTGRRNTTVVFVGGPADGSTEMLDQQHVTYAVAVNPTPCKHAGGFRVTEYSHFTYELARLPWDVDTRIAYPRSWGDGGKERAMNMLLKSYVEKRK